MSNVFYIENKVKWNFYVEQLERREDDGNVEIVSTQSICNLIGIELSTMIRIKRLETQPTIDRTDAKIGMNVKSAIKLALATLEYRSFSLTFRYQ